MHNKLISLVLKLSHINRAIESEHKRPASHWMRLFRLKRLRLKLKDRLLAVAAQFGPARNLSPALAYVDGSSSRLQRAKRTQGGRS